MSHFARVENGIVQEVIVLSNDSINEPEITFPETEKVGQKFIAEVLSLPGEWKQTSYSGSFRYNYAGEGHCFDPSFGAHGAFFAPKPYESWSLNSEALWEPPVPHPNDEKFYDWDEENRTWKEIHLEVVEEVSVEEIEALLNDS